MLGGIETAVRFEITTKSFGATALAVALKDNKSDSKTTLKYHPTFGVAGSNREAGWLDDITILHLTTQTAGFEARRVWLLFEPELSGTTAMADPTAGGMSHSDLSADHRSSCSSGCLHHWHNKRDLRWQEMVPGSVK